MGSGILLKLFIVLSGVFSLFLGLFLIFMPKKTIDMQMYFYSKINWKMEPISMQKEIRNTKIMGGFLIFLLSVLCVYSILS